MSEKEQPRLFDTRIELRVEMADIPYLRRTCNFFGVKYETIATEGQAYASNIDGPILLPDGYAWVKMRAQLPAGNGFNFIIDIAKDIRQFNESQENKAGF